MSRVFTNNVGGAALTEGPEEITYTLGGGFSTALTFRGTRTEMQTKLEALVTAGYSPIRMRNVDGDLWEVRADSVASDSSGTPATTSLDTYIKTEWMVPANAIEKELWELPSVKTAFDQVHTYFESGSYTGSGDADIKKSRGYQAIAYIRALIEALVGGQTKTTLLSPDGDEIEVNLRMEDILNECGLRGMDSTGKGTVRKLIGSLSRGVSKFPVSQWVLQRVQTGPRGSSLRGIRTNVNRMYATSKLVSDESVPSNLLDGIPTGYWMKQAPKVATDGDKIRVDSEWWWAEDYDRFTLGDPIT